MVRIFKLIGRKIVWALTQYIDFGYGLRRQIFFPLLGEGIFTQDGPLCKHSRLLLRPQFSQQKYQDFNVFREHVDNLISCIPENGAVVDMQQLFFRFTLDTTTGFLFGKSTYTLIDGKSKDGLNFAKAFDTAQDLVVKRFRLLDLYWFIGGPKFNQACNQAHKFIDDIIIERQVSLAKSQEKNEGHVFFDAVAESSVDKEALRGQLLNILLAGRDTTACLLSWTFHLLTRHSKVLLRLRTEIESVAGFSSDVTRNQLKSRRSFNVVGIRCTASRIRCRCR